MYQLKSFFTAHSFFMTGDYWILLAKTKKLKRDIFSTLFVAHQEKAS